MKKQKYYVVWVGNQPGIYDSWDKCQQQIKGYPNARYKSFESKAEAEAAYKDSAASYISPNTTVKRQASPRLFVPNSAIIQDSLAVDAACSGNPGDMEYRGVHTGSRQEWFHQGPFPQGTNNIGEFLALVHALALLQKEGKPDFPIYTDSKIAMGWVKKKAVGTKLTPTAKNRILFEMMDRAIRWLKANPYRNPIIKWETEDWGEIPADFGRK